MRKACRYDSSSSPAPRARVKSGFAVQESSNSTVARSGSSKSPRIAAPSTSVAIWPPSSRQAAIVGAGAGVAAGAGLPLMTTGRRPSAIASTRGGTFQPARPFGPR